MRKALTVLAAVVSVVLLALVFPSFKAAMDSAQLESRCMDDVLTALRYAESSSKEGFLDALGRINDDWVNNSPRDFKGAFWWLQLETVRARDLRDPVFTNALFDLNAVARKHGYSEQSLITMPRLMENRL